jgi:hypothetical protein
MRRDERAVFTCYSVISGDTFERAPDNITSAQEAAVMVAGLEGNTARSCLTLAAEAQPFGVGHGYARLLPREFGVPVPWEEPDEAGLRLVGDPGEDVSGPGLRIAVVEFCGRDERVHNGHPFRPRSDQKTATTSGPARAARQTMARIL